MIFPWYFPLPQAMAPHSARGACANEGVPAALARHAGRQGAAEEQGTEARGQPRMLDGESYGES